MAGAGYRLYTAGQVLTAAQVNTYLMEQSVMVFATTAARDAALTSIKSEGNVTYQLDNNDLDIYNGTSFSTLIEPTSGALKAWTPAVTQLGSVTVTNTHSTYMRIGRLIWAQWLVSVTGSGTGANVVTISLPVNNSGVSSSDVMGVAYLNDTSAGLWYNGVVQVAAASTCKIQSTNGNSFTYLGTNSFTAGLAVGDSISGSVTYEAGADA